MSQRQDPFVNIAYTCKFVIQVLSYTNFKYFWAKKEKKKEKHLVWTFIIVGWTEEVIA